MTLLVLHGHGQSALSCEAKTQNKIMSLEEGVLKFGVSGNSGCGKKSFIVKALELKFNFNTTISQPPFSEYQVEFSKDLFRVNSNKIPKAPLLSFLPFNNRLVSSTS